jgi:hypothetical protein
MKSIIITIIIIVSFACGYLYREAQVREHKQLQKPTIIEEFIQKDFPKNLKETCQISTRDGKVYKIRRIR